MYGNQDTAKVFSQNMSKICLNLRKKKKLLRKKNLMWHDLTTTISCYCLRASYIHMKLHTIHRITHVYEVKYFPSDTKISPPWVVHFSPVQMVFFEDLYVNKGLPFQLF